MKKIMLITAALSILACSEKESAILQARAEKLALMANKPACFPAKEKVPHGCEEALEEARRLDRIIESH